MTPSTNASVREAADATSRNIERYLAENSPERAQTTQMQMYDEQFEKQDAASISAEEFRSTFLS
jgi:hypothetical protein